MKTIQKRADELKPGDIIDFGIGRYVLLRGNSKGKTLEGEHYADFAAVALDVPMAVIKPVVLTGEYKTEVPALTPAQEHAEEMAELLRRIMIRVDDPMKLIPQEIAALLAKIDPPKAPTLEEALKALSSLRDINSVDVATYEKICAQADSILDRARRTQVLPS